VVAVWFGLFAIPFFLFTPDRPPTGRTVRDAGQTGLGSLLTMWQLLANRAIASFLLAHLFYTNGSTPCLPSAASMLPGPSR
jgi:UMF1 family MFS transporter